MNKLAAAALAFVLGTAGAFALPEPGPNRDRDMKLAQAHYEKGRAELGKVPALGTNARRLATLDRALYFLRRSRSVAMKAADPYFNDLTARVERDLVRALDRETEIYYERSSLSLARARNSEALALDPQDGPARNFAVMINAAENVDVADKYPGSVADRRIRDRRAAAGVPLRERGVGRRR